MQAIITKYLGPTNSRGARVKAKCQAGTLTLSWDDALDTDENHHMAALALARRLGWVSQTSGQTYAEESLYSGGLPSGDGNAYVLVTKHTRACVTSNTPPHMR